MKLLLEGDHPPHNPCGAGWGATPMYSKEFCSMNCTCNVPQVCTCAYHVCAVCPRCVYVLQLIGSRLLRRG